MTLMHTPVCEFGRPAIDFSLPDPDGRMWTLADCRGGKGTLVMFICNHCPYVQAILPELVADTRHLQALDIGVVAIMPNDSQAYPADSVDNMRLIASEQGFSFPYLVDASQQVARAYGAICTPDFFGYNAVLELQYRGRLDATTPGHPAPVGAPRELLEAMRQIAASGRGPEEQTPSMGCSIKWKSGQDPCRRLEIQ